MKKLPIIFGVLLSISCLASCNASQSGDPATTAGKKLIIFCSNTREHVTIEEFVENYNKELDFDIEIETLPLDVGYYKTLISEGRLDSCLVFGREYVTDVGKKIIDQNFVDLKTIVDEETINVLNQNLVNDLTYENKLLTLPLCWGTNAVSYDNRYFSDLFKEELDNKLSSYSNIQTLFSDIKSCWDHQVYVSIFRLEEIAYDYFANYDIEIPSDDSEANVQYLGQLLKSWSDMLDGVVVTENDNINVQQIACFLSYSFFNKPSTSDVGYFFTSFGEKHVGMIDGITYMQDVSISHKHDAIDDYVKDLCNGMVSSDSFMKAYCPNHDIKWPTAKQSLLEDPLYVSEVERSSKLTAQLLEQNIVNSLKVENDPIMRIKISEFLDGVFLIRKSGYTAIEAARKVINNINAEIGSK